MKRIIYADNAATTRIDPTVLEAMAPFTKEEYANASQPYSFSRKAKAAIKNAREEIAKCINAKPSEIFFTSGGTESDNWAIKGCAFADESKRTTITSTIEHHAVLHTLKKLEKEGLVIGQWDDPKKKFQKFYSLTPLGEKEFDNRKSLLKHKIEESLMVFQIVYKDLYL